MRFFHVLRLTCPSSCFPPSAALITEANRAFRFNANIFSCIDAKKTLDVEPIQKTSVLATTGASLGTLLAVILAISLTHAALVLGGFTGSAGGERLNIVLNWLRAGFTSQS